jgi:hypothetical protein
MKISPDVSSSTSDRARDALIEDETKASAQNPPPGTTFGSLGIRSLAPPVPTLPLSSPSSERFPVVADVEFVGQSPTGKQLEKQTGTLTVTADHDAERPGFYDDTKPTCSLNLVCYRSGAKGCGLEQV